MFRKLAPALLVPLLAVAACATEADDAAVEVRTGSAAVASLRSAPDVVTDAGSASYEMTMEMGVEGEAYELTAAGAYDARNQQMTMNIDMGAMFEQLAAGTGESLPAGLDGTMQMIVDGTTVYLRAPMFELLGGPTGWLSMSPEDLGTSSSALGLGGGTYDPSSILESLRGVTGEPEVVGTEEVRGVDTTHYRATMDLADAIAQVPEDQRALIEAELSQLGDGSVPIDVWVDADGLPRRMQMDMGSMLGSDELGSGATALMTMEFFDYGQPVDIQVPSADEVQPLSEALGGLGGLLGSAS